MTGAPLPEPTASPTATATATAAGDHDNVAIAIAGVLACGGRLVVRGDSAVGGGRR